MVKGIIRNVRKIYTFFEGYRLKAFVVFLFVFAFGLLESFGLASLIPLLEILSEEGSSGGNRIKVIVENIFAFLNLPVTVTTLLGFIGAIFILKSGFQFASRYGAAALAYGYEKDVRDRIFEDLFDTQWEFFTDQKHGYLLNDLIVQTRESQLVLQRTVRACSNLMVAFVYFCMALVISVPTTLMAIGFVFLVTLGLLPIIRESKRYGEKAVQEEKDFTDMAEQYISGFKSITSMNISSEVYEDIKNYTANIYGYQVWLKILQAISKVGTELIAAIGVLLFIYTGITYFGISLVEILVISGLFFRIYRKSSNLQQFQTLAQRLPSLEVVSQGLEDFSQYREESRVSGKTPTFKQKIEFDDVSFAYKENERALRNLNFSVPRGDMVGIVGGSGAGKTTLVDLLLGLLEYDSGEILVDGTPLRDINLAEWRELIGYVPQEGFLLNGTIEENIAFFRDIDEKKIYEAANLAHAHRFIENSAKGYETRVGQDGVKMSGGQRQRICLARALAGDPELLILDEATSELDSESEVEVQEALEDLRGEMTMLLIAHRLSTVLSSDEILVLEEGRLVESGSREELLSEDGTFAQIYEKQILETRDSS